MIEGTVCCEHHYDHNSNECNEISELNDKMDDRIDDYSGERDINDDDEDDLESTSSSISSPPSVPDEDINFDLVYALHSFAAVVTGQASVIKGDALILMDDSNSYWWLVEVLKTRELGYIPAENTETPFERLARLNKHRNVDITAPTTEDFLPPDDVQKKQRKNVTLGPEDDYMVLVFERDDYDDYDDLEGNYYNENGFGDEDTCNNDSGEKDEQTDFYDDATDDDTDFTPDDDLENGNVDQLTTTATSISVTPNTSAHTPLYESDSDENDLDTFEDAQQDFDGSPLAPSPITATTITETTTAIDATTIPENVIITTPDHIPPQNNAESYVHPHLNSKNSPNQRKQEDKVLDEKGVCQNHIDRTGRLETLRVFGGNILQGPLFHTFDIGLSTTAQELLDMAIERFSLDTGYETIEYYLSVQGLDGDDYILLAQDKPLPIFRTLTASLTTPMPRSSIEQQQQIAEAKKRLSSNSYNSIGNRRRSTSFSNYEQTYYDEDSLIRFYIHQRIKRGRAGLLYIKICLCRGSGHKKNLKNKNKKSSVIDRMEKIMAVQVDSQIGMVINEALAKFNVPDATAENFLGGLGDVRSFTKYRMSVYTKNNAEMALQATQDMATLLTLLQIKWNVGERTLLTSDLLFIIYPSGGDKKGQRHKAPNLPLSQQDSHQSYSQERRPSILDILMDIPCSKEQPSQNQGGAGVDSLTGDPLILPQKIPSDSDWNTCSPSSIRYPNPQRRRSSLYSTTSESSSIPDSTIDDMAFGFSNDKKVAASAPTSAKPNSLKQHFKRWVGWGPKKNQQQQQQQQTSPSSYQQPLMTSPSCIEEGVCDDITSADTLNQAPQQEPCDQGLRRPSNGTIGSVSSTSFHSEQILGTSSHVSNNLSSEPHGQSARHTSTTPVKQSTSNNTFCSSLTTSISNNNVQSPIKPSASNHSTIASTTTENEFHDSTMPTSTASPISSTSSETTASNQSTNQMVDPKLDRQTPPPPSWDQGHNIQDGHPDSLTDSDISSISNSSIELDSTLDRPYNQSGIAGNDQLAYEWLSDSENEDSDIDDGIGQQHQQQSSSQVNVESRESEDILVQYSSWMKRASLDAASTMNQHVNTASTITAAPPQNNTSPSASLLSSSSSSGSSSVGNNATLQTDYITDSSLPGQANIRYGVENETSDPGLVPVSDASSNNGGITSSIYSTSSFPSESFDTDALLLVTHGVDFLKDRESSNWEDDDTHQSKDNDNNDNRYAFHPWSLRTTNKIHMEEGNTTAASDLLPVVAIATDSRPRPLSTATSATKLSSTSTAVNHGKRPSTAGITPSTSSSTSTTIEPLIGAQKLSPKTGQGEKEGMDEELQRIVSMHVLF